ncbi:MAG: hypothetical protein HRT35_38185, partial [Algicola sp.]|nr:hypothetical protein [Algicola sp.]
QTLPEYMIPTAFVMMAAWPLSANGKLNKKALPLPDAAQLVGQYVAPSTPTESALVGIVADLLKIPPDKQGVSANFFEIGEHTK